MHFVLSRLSPINGEYQAFHNSASGLPESLSLGVFHSPVGSSRGAKHCTTRAKITILFYRMEGDFHDELH
jgi:hypothetical protein